MTALRLFIALSIFCSKGLVGTTTPKLGSRSDVKKAWLQSNVETYSAIAAKLTSQKKKRKNSSATSP